MKKTYNPKLSSEKFDKEELEMIKAIKKAGYILEFYVGNSGANLLEPYKSLITGKKYNREILFSTTIKEWDNSSTYPLKEWFELVTK